MSRNTTHPKHFSFAYHAQAIGFSASLRKPCCENIPGQAATSLSQTGGESHSVVRKFDWKGIFSFEEASSYVTGSEDHGSFNTLSTVSVRGLNIANMVTADQLIARVSTRHDLVNGVIEEEAHVSLAGSSIQGLRIAGHPVNVPLNFHRLDEAATFKAALACKEAIGAQQSGAKAVLNCTAADDMRGGGVELNRGRIVIPQFGTIYLAGVIIKPSYRRISMLRAELGCPIGGSVEVAGGEANGTDIWG
jgi:hypothetical protein